MELISYKSWFKDSEFRDKLVIAGPCSAENFDQLLQIFQYASNDSRWNMIRLGIWKPRSRPDSYSGNEEALLWVKDLKSKFKTPVIVEVANPRHVEMALNAGIDAFWIGARTVGLPFAVDEIAKSLRGINIPVCIKNPIGPDFSLWSGAVERFYQVGIDKLAIIHRGFSWHYSQEIRNWPLWSLVVQMKNLFPGITVIGDPSHMAGKCSLVPILAQDCISFGCDGIMVETHPNPVDALSDSLQQIPLDNFNNFLSELKYPQMIQNNSELDFYRLQIDEIDKKLIQLLKSRNEISFKIAKAKAKDQVQVVDYKRFNEILDSRKKWYGIENDYDFIEKVFHLIHEKSIQKQLSISDK